MAAVVAILAIAVAGCGTAKIVTPSTTASPQTDPTANGVPPLTQCYNATDPACQPVTTDTTTPTPQATGPQSATVGDTLTLQGNGSGESMQIKVLAVDDPWTSPNEFDQAANGTRYVAVTYTLKNVGTETYSDSFSNGATLILSDSSQADSTITMGSTSHMDISPGATRKGAVMYEVPNGVKPASFQVKLNSGMADQLGEWTIH